MDHRSYHQSPLPPATDFKPPPLVVTVQYQKRDLKQLGWRRASKVNTPSYPRLIQFVEEGIAGKLECDVGVVVAAGVLQNEGTR